jgi:TolB-like protein
MELLFLLVERKGAVVSHDEALRGVWGENVFLDGEAAIYTAIKKIRKVIGDPSLIQTVPGKGYRFRLDAATNDSALISSHVSNHQMEPDRTRLERLAILPLANLSHDPAQDYFADGLTEELIGAVSRLLRGQMGVIARTSAMRYRTASKSVQQIAQELQVQYLVEGSVRVDSKRVRIAVRLLRAADSTDLWSETFERPLSDAFVLQSEIAFSTASAIGRRICPTVVNSPSVIKGEPHPRIIDGEAHDRYLRARHLMGQRTRTGIQAAMRHLQGTLAIDPQFAPALASLAFCHALLPITSIQRSHDCFPAAQSLAADALEVDPSQADAHIALGLVDFWYRRDWQAARQHFWQAEALNPGESAPPMFLAHIHSVLGEHQEALAVLGQALRLDPISAIVRTHLGHFLYNAGRSQEAVIPLRQVLEIAPQFWVAHLMLGKALSTSDHTPGELPAPSNGRTEALEAFLRSEQTAMGNTEPLAFRIHTLAAWGEKDAAAEAMNQMRAIHQNTPAPALHRALAALGLGDRTASLELLEEGFAEQDVRLVFLGVESRWGALGEGQHISALQRAGLRPASDR